MNIQKTTQDLEKEYPGKIIVLGKSEHPKNEYVAALVEETDNHPHYSTQTIVLGTQMPHYHTKTAEICIVLKGTLELTMSGQKTELPEGAFKIIQPGQVHELHAQDAWVALYAEPGMTKNDTHYGSPSVPPSGTTADKGAPSEELVVYFKEHGITATRQGDELTVDIGNGKVFTLSIR